MIPNWTWNNHTEYPPLFEPTSEDYGFIYQIDYEDGTSYIDL